MNNLVIRWPAKPKQRKLFWGFVVLFGALVSLSLVQIAGAAIETDVDGDGKADLVWRKTSTGEVAIWLMDGATIETTGFLGGVPPAWEIVGMGDVNGDGQTDIIWRNAASGVVAIWMMNGSIISSVSFPGSASLDWAMQGVGDVNGDGQADLIWHNSTSGAVVVWLTNGATFGLGGMPLEWQVAGLGDVSGDGQVDVIWRNSANGEVVVWVMNGLRINTMDLPEHISTDWVFQGVGDVDGDSQADILWRNSTSGVVTLWLMNGATIESFGFLGPPTDWEIVQVGDVDGDGNADVIWRNSVNGEVSVWVMNGPVLAENSVIATSVPLDWMIQRGGDNSPPLFGLNFSPYLDGQDPNLEAQISESQIRERLAVIRPYAKWVRTFECGAGLEKIGRIAHQLGLKAAIGGKLSRDMTANQQQIDCLINAAKAGEADLVIVGSEALLHGDLTGAELVNLINQVKQEVPENIPVAYADVYSELLSYPDVVEAMDVVLVNYYPYLEGIKVDLGMPSIHGYHQQIIAAAKGKPIVVSETGWPSEGDTVGEAIPSVENACYYFQNFISWAEANAVDSFNFSAFDKSGNGVPEGSQGAYWDIWDIWDINRDETGTLKPCIQETLEGKRMGDNWSGMDLSDE